MFSRESAMTVKDYREIEMEENEKVACQDIRTQMSQECNREEGNEQ